MNKKLAVFFIALAFVCPSMFAQQVPDSSENILSESNVSQIPDYSKSESQIGGTLGFNISVLGFAVKGSFESNELEVGLEVPMMLQSSYSSTYSGTQNKYFGLALSPFFGWVDKPKRLGWQNRLGAMYTYFFPEYLDISPIFNGMNLGNQGAQMVSLYYNGTIKFNKTFGLEVGTKLPLVIFSDKILLTAIDPYFGWFFWASMFLNTGIGLKFEF